MNTYSPTMGQRKQLKSRIASLKARLRKAKEALKERPKVYGIVCRKVVFNSISDSEGREIVSGCRTTHVVAVYTSEKSAEEALPVLRAKFNKENAEALGLDPKEHQCISPWSHYQYMEREDFPLVLNTLAGEPIIVLEEEQLVSDFYDTEVVSYFLECLPSDLYWDEAE